MKMFQVVDDALLVGLIQAARKRVVFMAPGVFAPVADALGALFERDDGMDVTVIVDADEEVCRLGLGELNALKKLNGAARRPGMYLRNQTGLRLGVLVVDAETLVWSPTPRAVEDAPSSDAAAPLRPNGMWLDRLAGEQIARAVAAEGTQTQPVDAEIGAAALTPEQLAETVSALECNPPIPVDLARVTRVFSTRLQFVEWKVTHARLSQCQLSIDSALLNADAKNELQMLIDSRLKAFGELRDLECLVPAYVNGQPAMDQSGQPLMEPVSEAILEAERRGIERRFLYDIPGFGRLIERNRKAELENLVKVFEARLLAYSVLARAALDEQANRIIDDALELIAERARRRASGTLQPCPETLEKALRRSLAKARDEPPRISLVFKDVTYDQTQMPDFQAKVDKALPLPVRRRLGPWYEQFDTAREQRRDGSNSANERER